MLSKVARKEIRPEQKVEAAETVRVSAASSTETMCGFDSLPPVPHRLEQDVCRSLLANPKVCISSLVVHRIPNGVCIEGVLETDEGSPDVCALVRCLPGITEVVNHLVVRHVPPKG